MLCKIDSIQQNTTNLIGNTHSNQYKITIIMVTFCRNIECDNFIGEITKRNNLYKLTHHFSVNQNIQKYVQFLSVIPKHAILK